MSEVLKVGLQLAAVNPKFWAPVVREAERLGFESAWLPEHLVLPVEMSSSPHTGHAEPPIAASLPVADVFVSFALLAGQTSTIRFGTNVYNIGLRHPFVTARAVCTLDNVSGGRFDFGIGSSWLKEEWEATGLDFRTRGRRVDECIRVCQRLWSEEVIEHRGEFFRFDPVMFEPKPVQKPWPRIHVGGDSAAAQRRAAKLGDGWIPLNHPLDELPSAIRVVNEMREAAGRPGRTEITVNGSAESLADLERYRDAGVDRVITRPFRSSREALEGLRRFADQVLSRLR